MAKDVDQYVEEFVNEFVGAREEDADLVARKAIGSILSGFLEEFRERINARLTHSQLILAGKSLNAKYNLICKTLEKRFGNPILKYDGFKDYLI